jgi:signal transduction histidine kinase
MKIGSANIKIILVVISMGIVVGLLLYTQSIVTKLQERERAIANLSAKAFEYVGSEQSSTGDISFIFDEIIQSIVDFPIISTDPDHGQFTYRNISYLDEDSSMSYDEEQSYLREEAERMKESNPPMTLKYNDTTIIQYVYYDESDLVKELRYLPYIEILVASLFILIGYVSFSYIKRHEQSNIWVGMSKETAHQLGTPLSSIAGWIELIRAQQDNPAEMRETLNEMENDLGRLNRIALRFSKIGSIPDLDQQDINATIYKTVEYFRKRIPQMGNKIELVFESGFPIMARYNAELMEWVLENILKNAIDAIDTPQGKIVFSAHRSGNNVIVDISDTGKGIEKRMKKDIFRPGYSTKKRGWGLGLSLAKRIVENYHRGKLNVHESSVGKGTTFRIKIPA